jgi:hypothetical protein
MLDEALIEQLNRGYVCPPDAGPAWRAACEYGFDMSLVEDALTKTPEERLEEHQRALNLVLEIQAARPLNSPHGPG